MDFAAATASLVVIISSITSSSGGCGDVSGSDRTSSCGKSSKILT